MFKKRNLWFLAIGVSIGVVILISSFSAQTRAESNELSKSIAERILAMVQTVYPNITLGELNHFLRKLAHFTLYFILGCSLTGVFGRQRRIPPAMAAFLMGASFAALDEAHQFFSDGRAASVQDIILDSCGVAAGIILIRICAKLIWERPPKD